MNKLFKRGPALFFLLRAVVIFGLLIAPWPGWNAAYSRYFQALGEFVLGTSADSGPRKVVIAPSSGKREGLDTLIILQNTAMTAPDGKRMLRAEEIDSRSIGWVPTALTIALVLATPIPWTRRLMALAGGLVLIHLFILFSLESWLWNNATSVSLMALSGFWQQAADALNYALMNQLGVSFTVPVVIWAIVTFRRQDQDALST